jgi:multisubunit Na+/H+ antiporter MnhB subunit
MDGRGPFGMPALPHGRKLFLTVAMSLLGLLTVIRLIAEVVAGIGGWPPYLLGIAVIIVMIVMVRRTPTKRKT